MEAITHPLRVVARLAAAKAADPGAQDVNDYFQALLRDPAARSQIPILTEATAEAIPNQTLVRYRGMVQDMPSPEYYVGEFQRADGSWQSTKYCDQLDESMPPGCDTRVSERKPLLLVPVPGEAGWLAQQAQHAARDSVAGLTGNGAGQPGAGKRARGAEVDDSDDVSMGVSDATGHTRQTGCCAGMAGGEDTAASHGAAGRARLEAPEAQQAQQAQQTEEELPPGSCMIYVYDDDAELKLNDVVEVLGVLSRVPELAAAHMQAVEATDALSLMAEDLLSSHLPTSRVPRLHALLASPQPDPYAPAAPAGPFSALPAPAPGAPGLSASSGLDPEQLPEARGRAVGFLSMVLGGDDLAAEYLLLQLVSRVHLRGAESAVGVLPLNLIGCPPAPQQAQQGAGALSPFAASLAAALEALAPRTLALPLSIEALNRRPWWPRRDQNTQRLMPAPLQLAAGTQVLLDETVLAAGTLNEVGLRNLAALQALLKAQRVGYDFEYFALDQPADAPATVLSLGRTLLKDAGGVVLPLRPAAPLGDPASVAAACASADLAPVRAYLAAARQLDFAIDPEMGAFLEKELAGARQQEGGTKQEALHAWLNVARLVAVSFGEGSLSRERWAYAMALEARRRERLAAATAAAK